jgi:hypothetical protein
MVTGETVRGQVETGTNGETVRGLVETGTDGETVRGLVETGTNGETHGVLGTVEVTTGIATGDTANDGDKAGLMTGSVVGDRRGETGTELTEDDSDPTFNISDLGAVFSAAVWGTALTAAVWGTALTAAVWGTVLTAAVDSGQGKMTGQTGTSRILTRVFRYSDKVSAAT